MRFASIVSRCSFQNRQGDRNIYQDGELPGLVLWLAGTFHEIC